MVSAVELMKPLDNTQYASYRELQERVLKEFNRRVGEVPPGYTYQHLIDWALQNNWIQRANGRGYVVKVEKAA